MNLLNKKCEECGTNINKLQSWWSIYTLKAGTKLKCSNCGIEYKTNRIKRKKDEKIMVVINRFITLWIKCK